MNRCEEKVLEMMAECESDFSPLQMFHALINGAITLGLKNFDIDGNKLGSLLEGALSNALTAYNLANYAEISNGKQIHFGPSPGDG